jgi:hypothetical protein
MLTLLKRLLARSSKAEQASHDAPDGVPARSGG